LDGSANENENENKNKKELVQLNATPHDQLLIAIQSKQNYTFTIGK
jgi:hypothetical protein